MNARSYEIKLTGILARGHHGVLPEERRDGQEFVVDVEMSLERSGVDDVATTVDYAELAAQVVADVERDPVDLIETLADRIAATCLTYPMVDVVTVTVHKPQAPVGVPVADVAVTVVRWAPQRGVLSLGSNEGDSAGLLAEAVRRLSLVHGLVVTAVSPVYRTSPVGGVPQADYLNIVVLVEVVGDLLPLDLLSATQRIEDELGRVRDVRWGPRTLDIDVVHLSGVRWDEDELTLPHPRTHERAFVLVPWLDVDPDAFLPGRGRVADLVAAIDTSGVHRLADVRIEVP